MIDIHSHILPNVDDGSDGIETSLKLIESEINDGVTDLVLTPHFRANSIEHDKQYLIEKFSEFKNLVNGKYKDINLYLGEEVFYSSNFYDLLEKDKFITFGNNCILIEFSYYADTEISEIVYNVSKMGYIPIVAHIERYTYVNNVDLVNEIKDNGGYIQINADSIVGKTVKQFQKKVLNYVKNGVVDFVASDIHSFRGGELKNAYEVIRKKFGVKTSNDIFINNAKKIIF